jgi:dTDP-4-dehydrorhamnose reductase
MKNSKLLITGAEGMIGSNVATVFSEDTWDIRATGKKDCDVTSYKAIKEVFWDFKPDYVLHLAAITDLSLAEKDPALAYKVNTLGTQLVAIQAKKYNSFLIYISTGCVFSGDKEEAYTEWDTPSPKNIYGKSKLEGEKEILSILSDYLIIRTAWIMGGGRTKDKKFVGKICRLIENNTKEISAPSDIRGSPTYAKDLLNSIKLLIKDGYIGTFHLTNQGYCSRYEQAKWIVKVLGKEKEIKVKPYRGALNSYPIQKNEMLSNYKWNLLGLPKMRSWQEALKEYLEKEFRDA